MNRFYISDLHLGHANICKFTNTDGSFLRPWRDIEEHDEAIIKNWNEVVQPSDRVYLVGDAVINRKFLPKLKRLMGKKVLIMGNHDIFPALEYLEVFEDVRAYKVNPKEGFICSHIPLNPDQFERFGLNVHGHLHGNVMNDKRYFSVCVEQINYTPIEQSEMLRQARK